MTPQSIITTARNIINDADATLYRYSNTTLLGYVNDGMKEISSLNPKLFSDTLAVACVAGTVAQSITFASAQALLNVLCITGGAALTPFDVATMDQFNPGWRTDTAGDAKQWASIGTSPLEFFIYPKAPATAQSLDVEIVRIPTTLAISDSITEIPAAYEPALVDYVVYRAESTDDEHADSGRAASHLAAFVSKIKG